MLFNSYIFIFFFLPSVLILFYSLVFFNKKLSFYFLLFASLIFYFYWNFKFGALILLSILFNFFAGYAIQNFSKNIFYLTIGIIFNLLFLFYFKYTNFFISNFNYIFETNYNLKNIFLPLAISFFSIQQIGYLLDVYEKIYFEKNILKYSMFVLFFPQLIAGPIIHISDISNSLLNINKYKFYYKNFIYGILIFIIGLSKKVLLADNIGIYIDNGFSNLEALHFIETWFVTIMYTFQIYFDFSGYSDMAVGLALMFNVSLPFNFKSPLKSTSIINFWKNWHITLTSFLNTYIYYPIIKKNNSFYYIIFAIIFVFLISGFWHGANWTFVFWGIMNGIAVIINLIWKKTKLKLPKFFSRLITFSFICLSLICFRSPNIESYFYILDKLLFADIIFPNAISGLSLDLFFNVSYGHFHNILGNSSLYKACFFGLISFLITFFLNSTHDILKSPKIINRKFAFFIGVIFALSIISLEKINTFIYFQF